MAKIRQIPFLEGDNFLYFGHFGADHAGDPRTWHAAFPYDYDHQWILANGWVLVAGMTIPDLSIAGHTFVALPLIIRDVCPLCAGTFSQGMISPSCPRWNIYRGLTRQHVPACFYWDVLTQDPPPGFDWWY
jgi:hypothetical protein